MEKVISLLTCSCIFLSILALSSFPTFALETEALIPHIEILTPGVTRTVEITKIYNFPQDFGHFLILVVGYGGVSITLRKIDTEGDFLFLAGIGISSVGIVPVFKFGVTEVTLTEAVEIGDQSSPYGLLWILS
ncbi:MAG: hypothetical protein AMJ42_01065, partial [Deltaproteobacteria bacterium DG_8]